MRQHVAAGARVLVNITNDSWFGRSAGPYQHALINAIRAVENRTAIARSATTGISLFIDPFGRTYEATDLFTPAQLQLPPCQSANLRPFTLGTATSSLGAAC